MGSFVNRIFFGVIDGIRTRPDAFTERGADRYTTITIDLVGAVGLKPTTPGLKDRYSIS